MAWSLAGFSASLLNLIRDLCWESLVAFGARQVCNLSWAVEGGWLLLVHLIQDGRNK